MSTKRVIPQILLLFYFFLIFLIQPQSYKESVLNSKITCDGDSPKSDVCALEVIDDASLNLKTIHIKKACNSKSLCIPNPGKESMYSCVKKVNAKHIDDKCKYNGDCITNICGGGGKCLALTEGQQCNPDYVQCGPGLSCSYTLGKCTKLAQEGQQCVQDQIFCDYGLECDYINGICLPLASIENGQISGNNDLLCKNGMSYNGVCVGVKTDGVCKKKLLGIAECDSVVLDGAQFNGGSCTYFGDEDTEENNVCFLNTLQQQAFAQYIKKRDDKVNIEKFKDKKDHLIDEGLMRYSFGRKDLAELYVVYMASTDFLSRKLVKTGEEKFEISDGKKCEYKWLVKWWTGNKSNYLKGKSWMVMILIFGLLI